MGYTCIVWRQCLLAITTPEIMAPMMPTQPWSVPQMNRFLRCVVPSRALERRAVDRAVVVAGVVPDGCGGEGVGGDYV